MNTCVLEEPRSRTSNRSIFEENIVWLRDMELPKKWVRNYKRTMVRRHTPMFSTLVIVLEYVFCGIYWMGFFCFIPIFPITVALCGFQAGVILGLCNVALMLCTFHIHRRLPKSVPIANWESVSLYSYGWRNLPRSVRIRAKEIQAKVPSAEMQVEELRLRNEVLDPLLWVCYGGEWFCIARWE